MSPNLFKKLFYFAKLWPFCQSYRIITLNAFKLQCFITIIIIIFVVITEKRNFTRKQKLYYGAMEKKQKTAMKKL